jgi:hypothetical protein
MDCIRNFEAQSNIFHKPRIGRYILALFPGVEMAFQAGDAHGPMSIRYRASGVVSSIDSRLLRH